MFVFEKNMYIYYYKTIEGVLAMTINLKHLEDLLRCNNHIKIGFINETNILEVKASYKVVLTLELPSNTLEDNAQIIYDAIVSLENITLYIPKIYIPE